MSLEWMKQANDKAKKAREEGKPLLNQEGVKTEAQDPAFLYNYPWLNYDSNDKEKKCSVSSITVNKYCREVLTYLREKTDLSDRKRIQKIVEESLKLIAKDIEKGKI